MTLRQWQWLPQWVPCSSRNIPWQRWKRDVPNQSQTDMGWNKILQFISATSLTLMDLWHSCILKKLMQSTWAISSLPRLRLLLVDFGNWMMSFFSNFWNWKTNCHCLNSNVQWIDFLHVRCNPDVAPRLTSGGYEDKVHVITPINILFIGGGEFWSLMKIKLMLLPQSTCCS